MRRAGSLRVLRGLDGNRLLDDHLLRGGPRGLPRARYGCRLGVLVRARLGGREMWPQGLSDECGWQPVRRRISRHVRRRAHLPVRLWLGRRWVRGTSPYSRLLLAWRVRQRGAVARAPWAGRGTTVPSSTAAEAAFTADVSRRPSRSAMPQPLGTCECHACDEPTCPGTCSADGASGLRGCRRPSSTSVIQTDGLRYTVRQRRGAWILSRMR
jgi:hypothetical protein